MFFFAAIRLDGLTLLEAVFSKFVCGSNVLVLLLKIFLVQIWNFRQIFLSVRTWK